MYESDCESVVESLPLPPTVFVKSRLQDVGLSVDDTLRGMAGRARFEAEWLSPGPRNGKR